MEGETFQSQKGVETIPCDEGGMCLTELEKGDWVKLVGVDFGSRGAKKFSARAASEKAGGKIEVRLDGPEGKLLGTCEIGATGGCPEMEAVFLRDFRRIRQEGSLPGVHRR